MRVTQKKARPMFRFGDDRLSTPYAPTISKGSKNTPRRRPTSLLTDPEDSGGPVDEKERNPPDRTCSASVVYSQWRWRPCSRAVLQ